MHLVLTVYLWVYRDPGWKRRSRPPGCDGHYQGDQPKFSIGITILGP